MKIYDKQHDYFDATCKSFRDDETLLVRNYQQIDIDHRVFTARFDTNHSVYRIAPVVVGFCGKIYYIAHDNCGNFITSSDDPIIDNYKHMGYSGWPRMSVKETYEKILSGDLSLKWITSKQKPFEYSSFFKQYKCCYFSVSYDMFHHGISTLEIYPNLERLKFYQLVNSFQAYQELMMFLNGPMAEENKMKIEPISDKLKAESHGFDKFSFRKDKQK